MPRITFIYLNLNNLTLIFRQEFGAEVVVHSNGSLLDSSAGKIDLINNVLPQKITFFWGGANKYLNQLQQTLNKC